MSTLDKPWSWNATDEDWQVSYPCDRHLDPPYREMMRAIDVQAPAEVVYRWICQLKIAPYSYDWLDNLGRRSPRELTPGADQVELGQRFLIGPIVEFEKDHHVTGVVDPRYVKLYGACSVTYLVRPTGPTSCRLVVKGDLSCRSWWERARLYGLVWGDLIMMRKQLLTLKALAEGTAPEPASSRLFLGLGVLAAVGLAGYAVSYLIVLPKVGSGGFVPTSLGNRDGTPSVFATALAGFALLYAFAFLPVAVMVTVRKYRVSPAASVLAASLAGVSSLIEIVNNLPVVAAGVFPGELEHVPADVLLRLIQTDAIRFLALDVAGFTLAYLGLAAYALVEWKENRRPAYTMAASIGLFVANVPFLRFAPKAAVVLMAASILAMAPVAVWLGRTAAGRRARPGRVLRARSSAGTRLDLQRREG